MKKIRLMYQNSKESWQICLSLLQKKERSKKEKVGIFFFGLFGGLLWTWVTDGLAKEEKAWHERSL